MRGSALILCLCALAANACGEDVTVVRVTVEAGALVPELDALRVEVGGTTTTLGEGGLELPASFTITPGDETPSLSIQVEGVAGTEVRGFGQTTITVEPGRVVDASLTLITADFAISPQGGQYRLATESPAGGGDQSASVGDETIVVFSSGPEGCTGGCQGLIRVFDAEGSPVTTATGDDLAVALGPNEEEQPVVASNGAGAVLIAYLDGDALFVQPVSPADGWALIDAPLQASTTGSNLANPTIAALADDTFVVAWSEVPMGETERRIVARQIDGGAGVFAGDPFVVSGAGNARQPALTPLSEDQWLAAWRVVGGAAPGDLLTVRSFTGPTPDAAGEDIDTGAVFSAVGLLGFADGRSIAVWPRGGMEIDLVYRLVSLAGVTENDTPSDIAERAGPDAASPEIVTIGERRIAVIYHTCPSDCDVFMLPFDIASDGRAEQDGGPILLPADATGDQTDPSASVITDEMGTPTALFVTWTENYRESDARVEGRIVPLTP